MKELLGESISDIYVDKEHQFFVFFTPTYPKQRYEGWLYEVSSTHSIYHATTWLEEIIGIQNIYVDQQIIGIEIKEKKRCCGDKEKKCIYHEYFIKYHEGDFLESYGYILKTPKGLIEIDIRYETERASKSSLAHHGYMHFQIDKNEVPWIEKYGRKIHMYPWRESLRDKDDVEMIFNKIIGSVIKRNDD